MCTSGTCLAVVGAMLATAAAAVLSQPVYRCGNTYSQTPCANAIVVRADDPRTPDQKAQTDTATLLAARLAERMARERLASEHRLDAAAKRPSREKPAQPSISGQATTRPTSPDAGSKPRPDTKTRTRTNTKTKAKAASQASDHFIATARQDDTKKPPPGPPRN